MLEIRQLTKEYATGSFAVKPVDLDIAPGEFFALLGPSGCGKTTLLRLIAGLEVPSSGQILLDGARIDLLPPHQRSFNMVFQRYALFPHLSVRKNIEFGLRIKKIKPGEIRARAEEALALVRLEGFDHRAVQTLSGGQQQRVALARALVNRPRILLLDEPLSALDLKLRKEMQVELRAIQKKVGQTFIFVTHDQEEAFSLADRVAVMNDGVVEQVGLAQDIYDRPRSRFVAQFIGSTNFFGGELSLSRDGRPVVRLESGLELTVSEAQIPPDLRTEIGTDRGIGMGTGLRKSPAVDFMIRPERIEMRLSEPGSVGRIEGTVRDLIYRGATTDYWVELAEWPAQSFWVTTHRSELKHEARKGSRVWLDWQEGDARLLNR